MTKQNLTSDEVASRQNFAQYEDGLRKAGVSWGTNGALNNHMHTLEILGAYTSANSNRID